jgi:sigma-B regulation protein RsbQ
MDVIKRNNVQVKGRGGQAMVFAHGFGCDQHMWRWIVPAFEAQYQIVLFDHVGAGQSVLSAYDPVKYDSLRGYADDILEIGDALSLQKPILVGHSVSAIIGILAAIKMPHYFDKLILVAPSPCYINQNGYVGGFSRSDIEGLLESMDQNYLGWSSQMAPVIMSNGDNPQLGEELTNSFCRTDPDIARHFARVTFLSDYRAELPLVSIPTLTLQCSHDVIAPLSVGEYMHQHLPKDTLEILEATGHCPHMSAPQETIEAIKNFLTSNS